MKEIAFQIQRIGLVQSDDDIYYVDRHVALPHKGLAAYAACEAGLALLEQWVNELPGICDSGIFVSTPVLIIDQGWLAGMADAAPPHVVLTLSKRKELLPFEFFCGQLVDPSECAFRHLLGGNFQLSKVMKIEPDIERKSLGSWLIPPDVTSPCRRINVGTDCRIGPHLIWTRGASSDHCGDL